MLLDLARHLGPPHQSHLGLLRPGWLQNNATPEGIPTTLLTGNRFGDIETIIKTLRLVRKERMQLLHTHEFYMNMIGAVVARLARIPHVATIHGKNYYPERWRRRTAYRLLATRSAHVILVSEDLRKFFCQCTGVSENRVRMIHNGIDLQPFTALRRDPHLLESVGIPHDAFVIGTVGNLYPVKGHTFLIRAAHTVIQRHPSAHVIILGRGELENSLKNEAAILGISDRVHLLGYRTDTVDWLGVMNVFVLASLSEGLPLSLLEAMAASLPVVVTDVGGMPEVVRHGETGFIVPPSDPETLARKIFFLMGDPKRASRYGAAGKFLAAERFSIDRMANEYRSVYDDALRLKSPQRAHSL
jgi:glycosyltransferase involved in cell wall biosynthesis